MSIKLMLTRVDDRLIHGQVAIGWVKATGSEHIVVANDKVAGDDLQRSLMELATPSSLRVTICRVADTARVLSSPDLDCKRTILLFATPQDVLLAVNQGVKFEQLNVGGMRYQPGKQQIMKSISLDEKDLACFRQLVEKGIKIYVQMVPTDEAVDIRKYLSTPK